jgi:hypothetical protein
MNNKKLLFYKKQGNSLLVGLIAYWKLDNNLLDSHSIHNGTATSISYATGISGNGINFTGATQKADFGSSTDFEFSDGVSTDYPFSISYWIKYSSFGAFNIVCRKENGGFMSYTSNTGSEIRFIISKDSGFSGYILTETASVITTGIWYNIIHTYDGSKTVAGMKTYINGALVSATDLSSGVYTCMNNTGNSNLWLTGSSFGSVANHITDEFAIWNRVLTPLEITNIYNSGSGKFYPF